MFLNTAMKKFTLKCKNLAASEIEKKFKTVAAELTEMNLYLTYQPEATENETNI